MYNGIKRPKRKKFTIKFPTKFQMLAFEEEIINGVIRKNYKIKTQDLKADENLRWYDFEVSNLQAAGIDVSSQASVTMGVNRETLANNAEAAQETMDMAELIKELEEERTQQNNEQ